MEKVSCISTQDNQMELPPGFRFHPTDEELITHYLSPKVLDSSFHAGAIGEVNLNKVEPWDLPWMAKMGEKEWYFFCVRDRKYPTGLRTNRATEAGYWKATGKDKEIFSLKILVGMKKTLVFYRGRAPRGEKTDWVMHEFRLEGRFSMQNLPKTAKNEWVISRVFKKNSDGKKQNISELVRNRNYGENSQSSGLLPPLMDLSSHENQTKQTLPEERRDQHFTPLILPKVSTQNSIFSTQMSQNLQFSDSLWMQDESILKLLLQNNGQNLQFSNDEMGLGTCEEEFPIISTATLDLDCLWDC